MAATDAQVMQAVAPICKRALEREPECRYATAEEMQSDLLEVLERLEVADKAMESDTTVGLRAFVRQLFERERHDSARRISLLIAVDDALESNALHEEHGRNFVTSNFRLPTFLRLAPPTVQHLTAPVQLKAAATPRARDSGAPVAMPYSRPPNAPSSIPPAREWLERRLPAILIAAVGVGLIGFTWSFSRTDSLDEATAAAALHAKPQEQSAVLRLCGSNTVGAELAPALVEALFASRNSATSVSHERATDSSSSRIRASLDNQALTAEISARGTSTGFVGLGDGSCDIAMASRPVNGAEAAQFVAKGLGDLHSPANEHVIALDGVAIIVHPDNRVSSLSRASLRDIFAGRIKNWSAVGGSDMDIQLVARDDKSGTHDTFQHLILDPEKIAVSARRHASNVALADAVAVDPAAIGFVGLAHVRTAKTLAVSEAHAPPRLPTPFTVATESYLLTRRLYFYTTSEPRTPWVSELVSFALSPAGQAIAKKAGFIDLTPLVDSSHCHECSSRYRSVTAHAIRASADIRFQSGSVEPDSRARRDLNRLVTLLNEYRQSKVLLLGFSDGLGNPTENLKLSYDRANAVAEELAMRGVQAPVVLGFGSEMPITSNDTPEGRERNRRVEVWLQQR
jgi:phosphate transport system substrate-binding protein